MDNDLISRQAAIDVILDDKIGEKTLEIMREAGLENEAKTLNMACDRHVEFIKEISSAELRWIPVTERLPAKYIGEWLCCTDEGEIMVLPYDTPGDGSKECVFYKWDDDYYYQIFNVVAWMPLPEPYKEDTE